MIALIELTMRFGAKILFKQVNLQFNPGNRYGLIGANGCGKSTLIKILTGEICADAGHVTIPQQLTLGSLKQDHYLYENERVMDVVLRGKQLLWHSLEEKKRILQREPFTDNDCQALSRLEKIIEDQDGYTAEGEAAKLLEGLGIRGESHQKPLHLLSGGYKLRVLLAQLFFGKHAILVLDEPTNHLDLYSIKWLEGYLRNFPGTLIVTSHDRDFLNNICTHIADVDYGTIKIYKGDYETFAKQKKQDREQKEAMLNKHDKRREDLQGFIDRFGAKATKARQAQSKARLVEKIEDEMDSLNLLPTSRLYPNLNFAPERASGVTVLKAKNLYKTYGSKKVLQNVSFEIERGDRLAIIGPNGVGKSTLLEILTDHVQPDQGEFDWGFATQVAYFPQDHAREVQGDLNLLDWLGQFDRTKTQEQVREILGLVKFSGDTVKQPIHTLSGGETARLILAKMMLLKPNVLIFDEPTNHLDLEAIDELTKALQNYSGTLLLVSHNRYFVSHIANRILEINYQKIEDFKGSYPEYVEKQEKDHLSKPKALSQRYAHEEAKINSLSTYQDQKRLKSLKTQLKKRVFLAEEECHKIEEKIKEIEQIMTSERFYQISTREKQLEYTQEKQLLENALMTSMEKWEIASLELQQSEAENE
ncbi:putative ABC transporter ATP-binding protein YkpA [Candidatus Protochlamydia amoebophila]|uniref:ABC-F family ATP-binding cassette domain-containing protein n=1 Tax=Candidatus Protochlamydia amoebophila TaxID=362787 RepID=UPI001BC8FC51|nr:ABC-F family ATP-binding cassette domain-containing protein [Candidatus Protochlamydia amoebophila]MBS4162739.1 putative ABC transporter ATP-binding protein YkpA [Candidatus Protochlamydia amoebophila]